MDGFSGLIAHRGGGRLAPENTLEGLATGAAWGYRCVEFDVMLLGDGTPVLIHDETLGRTTQQSGRVTALRAADLRTIRANRGFEVRFPEARLPTLGEAATQCRALSLWANVEIKPATGEDARTAAVVARGVEGDFAPGRALLSSFSEVALAVAAEVAPAVPRAVLFEQPPDDWLARARRVGACGMHCHWAAVTPVVLAEAGAAGIPVRCYTVNDRDRALRLLAKGVAAVFTDALDLFQGVIGSPPAQ